MQAGLCSGLHLPMFENSTFHITTFGCQMNKHDSERIAGLLASLGSTQVDCLEDADICVFMTCCVRENADNRLMGNVASMKNVPIRQNSPYSKRYVAIGGCIGQRDGEGLLKSLKHVDVVFGTHNLEELPHLLDDAIVHGERSACISEGRVEFHDELPEKRERWWSAWLPITVGCNNFCTYCVVPYVRGREISRPFEEVVEVAKRYVEEGVKEITLLGQNVNSYGRDLYGEPRFDEVLDAVANTGIARLRFATSHPKDLTDGVIERFATRDNLMPALHLPVQSGSNRILELMNRRYDRDHYLGLVDKLRQACPDIALSTDVIVGFPGETEQDFEQTLQLIDEVGYHQVFSFIYSKRAGTPAASMPDDTPREVIQERFDRLLKVVERNAYDLNQVEDGAIVEVLVEDDGTSSEGDKHAGVMSGKSPKNQTVHIAPSDSCARPHPGEIVRARIVQARTWYLKGELLDA